MLALYVFLPATLSYACDVSADKDI